MISLTKPTTKELEKDLKMETIGPGDTFSVEYQRGRGGRVVLRCLQGMCGRYGLLQKEGSSQGERQTEEGGEEEQGAADRSENQEALRGRYVTEEAENVWAELEKRIWTMQ